MAAVLLHQLTTMQLGGHDFACGARCHVAADGASGLHYAWLVVAASEQRTDTERLEATCGRQ